MDDLNLHVTRYRPEELDKLAKTTKFTRKEIQLIYRGFKQVKQNFNSVLVGTTRACQKYICFCMCFFYYFLQECPTGLVDEEAFKDIFAQFFPQGGKII